MIHNKSCSICNKNNECSTERSSRNSAKNNANLQKSNRGGKREGAGRPKQGDEVFYKRCTHEQKQKLEEYWNKLIADN